MDLSIPSALWERTLSERAVRTAASGSDNDGRVRLRSALLAFRTRATSLAAEIGRDQPFLTVHDVTHMDALWETADKIVGPALTNGLTPYLNPAEAFVLGGAFLIHDLAQSRAALQRSDSDLESDPRFADILADVQLQAPDLNFQSQWHEALATFLRENHAELSTTLLTSTWVGLDGSTMHLLADEELRQVYGRAMSQVAASHQSSVADLTRIFPQPLGAPVFLPDDWTCDLLKLACLIRVADAAHLDARRAPAFVAALRRPRGLSAQHWAFQAKLNRVMSLGDRLVYSSGIAFPREQAESWWLCYDSLRMVDRELAGVDALLADSNRPRYEVKSVAGVEDPSRLANYIPTTDWVPVDTQIRVGNVAQLVQRLGGEQLYGDNVYAPLRELIQNAQDAVLARRILEDRPDTWGEIKVEVGKRDGDWWLRVSDTGIGMSPNVLTGALLDFGTSFWSSAEARKEFPGLQGKRFKSTGRFGIGFFSTFMLGSVVRVYTKRYDFGLSEAKVLEFFNGARSRPILRNLHISEAKVDGTRIDIKLDKDPLTRGGLLSGKDIPFAQPTLQQICAWLCPALDVELSARFGDDAWMTCVDPSDWSKLPAKELLRRLHGEPEADSDLKRLCGLAEPNLRPLFSEQGKIVARLAIALRDFPHAYIEDAAVITVGGCRADGVHDTVGIAVGEATRASRDKALACYTKEEHDRWAKEQLALIRKSNALDEEKASGAQYLLQHGIDPEDLPLVQTTSGWLNRQQLRDFLIHQRAVVITSATHLVHERVTEIASNVMFCETHRYMPSQNEDGTLSVVRTWTLMAQIIVDSAADVWGLQSSQITESSLQSGEDFDYTAVIGTDKFGNPVTYSYVDVIGRTRSDCSAAIIDE